MRFDSVKFFAIGALISSAILVVGLKIVTRSYIKVNDVALVGQFLIMTIALSTAVFEEIVFRYYLIKYLKRITSVFVTILISSLIFAFFHLGNPNVSGLAIFSHFMGGIIYASAYSLSKKLSLAIGLHFGWNYVQMILSLPMSGRLREGWFTIHLPLDHEIYGGLYGIEGGWISILFRVIILTICLLLFFKIYSRRNKLKIS